MNYGDIVRRGYEEGKVTSIVSDTEVRVYWYSGTNLYHETVNVKDLVLVQRKACNR